MLKNNNTFSSFSVNDLEAAKKFYEETLGIAIEERTGMGLALKLVGNEVFIYPKPDHVPATFTVLNFLVSNIDEAVDELKTKGVVFERYENMHMDEKDIARGIAAQMGPDIAWFKDPAGNILSVLQDK